MQDKTLARSPKSPPKKALGIGEDPSGLITAYIRMVDEISREHVMQPLRRSQE